MSGGRRSICQRRLYSCTSKYGKEGGQSSCEECDQEGRSEEDVASEQPLAGDGLRSVREASTKARKFGLWALVRPVLPFLSAGRRVEARSGGIWHINVNISTSIVKRSHGLRVKRQWERLDSRGMVRQVSRAWATIPYCLVTLPQPHLLLEPWLLQLGKEDPAGSCLARE